MSVPSAQLVAGGDINPSRFVRISTAANKTVLEADAGSRTYGISQEGTQDTPLPNASTLAAAAGDQLRLYKRGEIALLEIGSGGCTAGDALKSDGDGKGVTTTTNNDWVGAEALETAAAGEKALVEVVGYFYGA